MIDDPRINKELIEILERISEKYERENNNENYKSRLEVTWREAGKFADASERRILNGESSLDNELEHHLTFSCNLLVGGPENDSSLLAAKRLMGKCIWGDLGEKIRAMGEPFIPCGRGVCCMNDGHEGECEQ